MEANEVAQNGAICQHRREFCRSYDCRAGGRIFKADGRRLPGRIRQRSPCGALRRRNSSAAMPPRNAGRSRRNRPVKLRKRVAVSGRHQSSDGRRLLWRRRQHGGAAGGAGLQPGGIACSAVVRFSIGSRLVLEFIVLGVKTVKNIAQPVHCLLRRSAGLRSCMTLRRAALGAVLTRFVRREAVDRRPGRLPT